MRSAELIESVKTVPGNRRDSCPGGRKALPVADTGKHVD